MNSKTQSQPLREVITLDKGKPPAQQPYHGPSSERYLTPDYLRGKAETEQVKPSANAVHVDEGETIILWDGSNAGEVFRARSGILASTMMRVRHISDYEDDYFYYALKGWEDYLKGQTSGSGIPHVDKEILGNLKLFKYTKPEQTKIAEVLTTVDRAIEQTEDAIAKQQRIKTGLMHDLLTRGIDEHGNLRSEETHEFWDSQLGRIPVEWGVVSLNSISDFVTSGARYWAKYYSVEGAVFIRIGNLTRDHINLRLDDKVFIRPPNTAEARRTLVAPGDLLISVTADLGIIGVIPRLFGQGYVNQHIALIRLLQDQVDSRFVGWFLQGRGGQKQFEQHNDSGAKAGLNLPTIRSLIIACPHKNEQTKIAKILDTNIEIIDKQQAKLKKLHSLKTGLMHDLLPGKVPVTPLLNQAEVGT